MEEEVHETYLQDMNSKYVYPIIFQLNRNTLINIRSQ